MSSRLGLYWHTVRYLKAEQIVGRLRHKFRLRTPAQLGIPSQNGKPLSTIGLKSHFPWQPETDVANGSFCFLNRREALGFPPTWDVQNQPLLWQFNLHYFNYIEHLTDEKVRVLCHDWIEKNPVGQGVGWHPYTISLRLINWTKNCPSDDVISNSIYEQARFLSDNLEYHIGGNHLLENARALMYAAKYFEGNIEAQKWETDAMRLFETEISNQVLSDGGHFERSPMYHALMLEGLLDVISMMDPTHHAVSELRQAGQKMMDFLVSLTSPDGTIALLNDATYEIAPTTAELVKYGKKVLDYVPEKRTTFPESGYFVHESDSVYICIDGGPVGPDHLPAHAHADIFSYVLSVQGTQFVVDTGVFEYQAGEMRDYVRGTAAHNTLQIDQFDQAECWSSFRVARRYRPHGISFNNSSKAFRFEGSFDGYGKLLKEELSHKRQIDGQLDEQNFIEVFDHVTGVKKHDITTRVHLHPEVIIKSMDGGLELVRAGISVLFECDKQFRIADTWYCPEFGMRVANKTIEIFAELHGEAELKYRFRF